MVKVKSQLLNADAFSSYCVGGFKETFRYISILFHCVTWNWTILYVLSFSVSNLVFDQTDKKQIFEIRGISENYLCSEV